MNKRELRALRQDIVNAVEDLIFAMLDDNCPESLVLPAEKAWRSARNGLDGEILRRALERKNALRPTSKRKKADK